MNPIDEYKRWEREPYEATVEEWENWAKRIIQLIEAEFEAAKKDYERIAQLEAELKAAYKKADGQNGV